MLKPKPSPSPPAKPVQRAALYARYSTTMQDSRSVEDQLRDCRSRCTAEGWAVVETFADYAISGAVRERPALNSMLARVAAGDIDLVISEALDRVSRDQEDIANIFKRIRFGGARLITLSEGEISELHIGLKGTMSALFRTDLADKIRRGQRGRVAAGRIPGGICYGYRKVIQLRPDGEPERGIREIDPDQAYVVRRIVTEFLSGRSALAIAKDLNSAGIPGPRGRWCASMINGDPNRQNGILHNEIYAGRLIYNRSTMVQDPTTRRRLSRINPRELWQVVDVPELAIISAEDWQAVRELRARQEGRPFNRQARPKRLLSGLIKCSACGSDYIVANATTWGCGSHRAHRGCINARRIADKGLERRILVALRDQMLDPEAVALFVREYHTAIAKERRDADRDGARFRKAANLASAKIKRLVDVIANGGGDIQEILEALRTARTDQRAANAALGELDAGDVLALHPNIADAYRAQVAILDDALIADSAAPAPAKAFRNTIARIIATPKADGKGCTLTIEAHLSSLISLASGHMPDRQGLQMVAKEGFEPPTPGL